MQYYDQCVQSHDKSNIGYIRYKSLRILRVGELKSSREV